MTHWTVARAEEVCQLVSDETLSGFNVAQLWSLYIGLHRLQLAEPLQSAVRQLAEQIDRYGSKHHWRRGEQVDSLGGRAVGPNVVGGSKQMVTCPECMGTGTCHGCEYEEEYDLLGGLPKHDRCLRCDGNKQVVKDD